MKNTLNQNYEFFLQSYNPLFSENQFGFLQNRSVNDEQLFVSKYIHKNLDFNNKGIFMYVKKIFDNINYE